MPPKNRIIKDPKFKPLVLRNLKHITNAVELKFRRIKRKGLKHTVIYQCMPMETYELKKKKKPVSQIEYYWNLSEIGNVIYENFNFDTNKQYQISLLLDDGWKIATEGFIDGQKMLNKIENVIYWVDSDVSELNRGDHVYGFQIDEVSI